MKNNNTWVMVSTKENSLSELLGVTLPKRVLAGLRGVTSEVPVAFAAKPAFRYGLGEPAMDALAEAAHAYIHDDPHATDAGTQARAAPMPIDEIEFISLRAIVDCKIIASILSCICRIIFHPDLGAFMQCRLVEENEASAEVSALYNEIKQTLNTAALPNYVKALGAHPSLLKANWEKVKHTIVEGTIPTLLKELIIFRVSVLNGSPYCSACHAHSALQLDKSLSFDDMVVLSEGKSLPQLPKSYQVALEIVPRVTVNPHTYSDADRDALMAQGFSELEVMELFAQGDIALMFNAITMLYRVPLDPEYRPVIDSSLHGCDVPAPIQSRA